MASEEKEPDTFEAFMAPGECSDEITFVFNDDRRLYVSQNLLTLASPVFKAMFDSKSNFKENTERTVTMVDIEFVDFLEFLYCIHPNIQKPLAYDNVLNIASVAEKYQSQLIVSRCKNTIELYLNTLSSHFYSSHVDRYKDVHICLLILHKALELEYTEISENSILKIGKFGSQYFTGMEFSHREYDEDDEDDVKEKTAKEQCSQAFMKLCPDVRIKLLIARLRKCDDMKFK